MIIGNTERATLEHLFKRKQKYVGENGFSIVLSM